MRRRADPKDPAVTTGAAYRVFASAIVLGIVGILVWGIAKPDAPRLPLQFRLHEPSLSGLPVQIDRVESCSCWHGPRGQAQRKFRFRVINRTDNRLDIGGGARSVLRLLVAYPEDVTPRLTLPARSSQDDWVRAASPPDTEIRLASEVREVAPSRIVGSQTLFAVPRDFRVWAIPAVEDKVAEALDYYPDGTINLSFTTVVDKPGLLPNEAYYDTDLGHGTWTFYFPVPTRISAMFAGEMHPVVQSQHFAKDLIIVGIAAFDVSSTNGPKLIGFAPAPSDDALADPSYL